MAALIIILAFVVGFITNPVPHFESCTVGYSGTDMNLTVQGTGANQKCQSLGTGDPVDSMAAYPTQPSGTLVCRLTIDNLTYTVRDTGALKLYGNEQCDTLRQEGIPLFGSNAPPGPTMGHIPG